MKNKILFLINTLCVAMLMIIPYVNEGLRIKHSDNLILRNFLKALIVYRLEIAVSCVIFILIYTWYLKCQGLTGEKRKIIKDILQRMNIELFGGDQHLHRITLFREINYLKAFIKNYKSFLYHLFAFFKKAGLYIAPPKIGRYLGVYERCGHQFRKSTTMLRVEYNDPGKCEGIASLIRYYNVAGEKADLPDITNISDNELLEAKKVDDLKRTTRKEVEEYMKEGKIKDFKLLKKIHRRARHFYGTIIQHKSGIWGVLLVDSISETNPLSNYNLKTRFNSFATTISSIINMEV